MDPKAELRTKAGRAAWEHSFSTLILQPEMKDLPRHLARLEEVVKEDQSAAESALAFIIKERGDPKIVQQGSIVRHPLFWRPRVFVDLANVTFKVGLEKLKAESPNFARFLEKRASLSKTKALVEVVKLQELLIKRFEKRMESCQLDGVTIGDFLCKFFRNQQEAEEARELTATFMDAFNGVIEELFSWSAWGERARESCQVSYMI